MPTVAPFHSNKPINFLAQGLMGLATNVYHNNSACTEGNNIEVRYWTPGTGGRVQCQHCAMLQARGQ